MKVLRECDHPAGVGAPCARSRLHFDHGTGIARLPGAGGLQC